VGRHELDCVVSSVPAAGYCVFAYAALSYGNGCDALVKLQSLNLFGCTLLAGLAPLSALVNLQSLDMSKCSSVSDLSPLGALVNLQSLGMGYCSTVSDLSPLTALVNLKNLRLLGGVFSAADLPTLQRRLDRGDFWLFLASLTDFSLWDMMDFTDFWMPYETMRR
jgi:hypothetical protein